MICRGLDALVGLLAVCAALVATPAAAQAALPVTEKFDGTSAPGFVLGGDAYLTGPAGSGWLRLTDSWTQQFGYTYLDEAFSSGAGVLAEFDLAMYGGGGADGISVFLFDGATAPGDFTIGAPGGSLGYTSCTGDDGEEVASPGVKNAYLGIGFDLWGNFTSRAVCGLDGTVSRSNTVGVRGPAADGFPLLTSKYANRTLQTSRAQPHRASVFITPAGRLTVTMRYGDGTSQVLVDRLAVPPPPPTLKIGFAASTGGVTNTHEVRNLSIMRPSELVVDLQRTGPAPRRGERSQWELTVANDGSVPVPAVRTRLETTGLEDLTWTCSATPGSSCATTGGTGSGPFVSGQLAAGGTLTYRFDARVGAAAQAADLTAGVSGLDAGGDPLPPEHAAVAEGPLEIELSTPPLLTGSSGWRVDALWDLTLIGQVDTATARWLRCSPGTDDCVSIGTPGSVYWSAGYLWVSAYYLFTPADLGHDIRMRLAVTNAAGTKTITSEPAWTPSTTAGTGPSEASPTGDFAIEFSVAAAGTYAECSLDGGAWEICTSPWTGSVDDGDHVARVRARVGNVADPTPAEYRWTSDTTAPDAPMLRAAPKSSPDRTANFEIETEAGAQLRCRLDGAPETDCDANHRLSELSLGEHVLEIVAVDRFDRRSPATSHRWTVLEPAPEPTPDPAAPAPAPTPTPEPEPAPLAPPEASVTLPKGKLVLKNGRLPVSCEAGAVRIERCTVRIEARVGGRTRLLGVTRVKPKSGATRVRAGVRLSADGRRSLARFAAGLEVTVKTRVRVAGGVTANAETKARLFAPRVAVRIDVWPLEGFGVNVGKAARGRLAPIAAQLGDARRITCVGHTDSRGSAAANIMMGLLRAQSVCDTLTGLGVKATKAVQSWGESRPRASNRTAAGRHKNRRVELIVRH